MKVKHLGKLHYITRVNIVNVYSEIYNAARRQLFGKDKIEPGNLRWGMSTSERIRKIRIYLRLRSKLYSFCWMNLLTDGSLSFGFTSKTQKLVEFGAAVVRSGVFSEHAQILTRGTVDTRIQKSLMSHSIRREFSRGAVLHM